MKTTGILGIVLAAVLVLVSFAACQPEQSGQPASSALTDASAADSGGLYRMENYENSEVFQIAKVNAGADYDDFCTTYKFSYLSDGLKINAYVSIPVSVADTQKPGKCLMFNHGGNRDYGALTKATTARVSYACKRIVIASQYRGCGGSQGKDQFGGDDLRDVIKLIDLCENHFSFIDMDDFCVAGASRGGVMTYPAARQDKRIKRIIALSAESDLFEAYESRDDMKTVLKETIGYTPDENPEEYKKRSAVYWADEIKVPVLMFHAKQDKQVSYSQAEELYAKLKDSTDCTFITYDDDSHAIIHPEDIGTIRDWLKGTSKNSLN
nr:prolyl oligopeptidase family serine peptidase [uncultured Ruminococcus sp.]